MADLYEKFVDKIAQLPISAFSRFIEFHDSPINVKALVLIIRLLMPALLPCSTPHPHDVHPEADEQEAVSACILEKCYLPFAYRTAENNAKLSLATETLFRILWVQECVPWTPSLQKAVEKGVKARNNKSTQKKTKSREDGDSVARAMLRASGSRLLALVELLRLQQE